jgi:hypothetical protein
MGEMAYRTGSLSFDEAFNLGIVDEWGSDSNQTMNLKTCRCCGTEGLHWAQQEGKWRLFDDNGMHKCKVNPLNPNFNKEPSNAD